MFRSAAATSLRALVGLSRPLCSRKPTSFSKPLFSSSYITPTRTYCKEAPKPSLKPQIDKKDIVKDVPHTAMDADVDLQWELSPTLPISMEPRKYIEFDCAVCDTRVKKTCSTHSYEKGVVLIKCPGCEKLHLIADHLGWTGYGDHEKTIEDIAKNLGKTVQRSK